MMFKGTAGKTGSKRSLRQAGNAIVMLFAAIGMAGVVTYGLNNIMRGPAVTSAEISRRTIAENNLIASSRLAIASAVKNQQNAGDCDRDGFVEAMPSRAPASPSQAPVGGGLLPMNMGASISDPWGNQYGYCVWDPGTVTVTDNVAACGGNTARRLKGSPKDNQPAIAMISAGKNGLFETSCAAYADISPADGIPDGKMINRPAASDDIVLSYTYAEANGIGGGEWKIKEDAPDIATVSKNIGVSGGGRFSGAVKAAGGFRLPQSTGGDNTTGPCDASKDQQLRINTSTATPSLEICNNNSWTLVSGGSTTAAPGSYPTCTFAPLKKEAEMTNVDNSIVHIEGSKMWTFTNSGGSGCYSQLALMSSPTTATMAMLLDDDCAKLNPRDVVFKGNYMYFHGDTAIQVFDRSPASSYINKGKVAIPNLAGGTSIAMLDDTHVVAVGYDNDYLVVVDVSNPATPTIVGSVTDSNWLDGPEKVVVVGKYAYVSAVNKSAITAVNLTNPAAPALAGHVVLSGPASDLKVFDGRYLITTSMWAWDAKMHTINVSSPGTPTIAATTSFDELKQNYNETSLFGKYLLAIANHSRHVVIFDLSDPLSPKVAKTYIGADGVIGDETGVPFINGNHMYVPSYVYSNNHAGVFVYNLGCDPVTGAYDTSAYANEDEPNPMATPDALDTNLLGWWKMDEGTGTAVADSSGNNRGGTFVNTPVWLSGVAGSGALNFNRYDRDAVQINGLLGLNSLTSNTAAVTVAAWVNYQGNPNGSQVFSAGDHLLVNVGDYGAAARYYDGSAWNSANSNEELAGTGWHHIVATFDDPNNFFRIYVDGVLKDEQTYTQPMKLTGLGANTFIGRHGNAGTSNDFDGAIDDVRVYGVALSPAEVDRLYKRSRDTSMATRLANVAPGNNYRQGRLSAYDTNTCAIKPNGKLYCWGDDTYGQLGNGANITGDRPSPYPVDSNNTYNYVSVGRWHSCAIRTDGTLWCWGDNTGGKLGIGSAIAAHTPTAVSGGGLWSQVAAGFGHTCGIKSTGTLWCWGSASYGVLGNGGGGSTNVPVQIGTDRWSYISVSDSTSCGIKSDGALWCWGSNDQGKLGNGLADTAGQITPYQVPEEGPWANVSAGPYFTCAVKVDGRPYCWGNDAGGQLGNGSWLNSNQSLPRVVGGLGRVSYVSAGKGNTPCAIRPDGKAFCWGYDNVGQAGNGPAAYTNILTPTPVLGLGNVVAAAGGGNHNCAMSDDGSFWCWGLDDDGQLGNGTTLTSLQSSPTPVVNWVDKPTFFYDDAASIIQALPGYNLALGGSYLAAGNGGFGFNGTGKASLFQSIDSNQLLLETALSNASTQLSFRTAADTASTDYTTNLVAKWTLDASSGTTTTSAPGSYVGTLTNGPTWIPNYGRNAGALYFDGNNDYVEVPRNAALEPTAITIATWILLDGPQVANAKAIDKIWNGSSGPTWISYALAMKQNGNGVSFETGHSGTADALYSTDNIPYKTWVYVVMTYDPAAAGQNKKLYINGALNASKAMGNTPIAYDTNATTGRLRLGNSQRTDIVEPFKGALDDVRIYNVALTAAQVQQLYSYQTSLFQVPRSLGINYSTNNLEISRNNAGVTNWLNAISPDIALACSSCSAGSVGKVGIGTATPQAQMDVNGSVKIGNEGACGTGMAGKMRYNASETPPWKFCDGTSWSAFPSGGTLTWRKNKNAFSAGTSNSCAIKADGSLWCWGGNTFGSVGDNSTNGRNVPTRVHTNSSATGWFDWVQVTTAVTEPATTGNDTHSCGVRSNGTAWCWGLAALGRLGDATTAPDKLRPVQVLNSAGSGYWTDWVKLSAGDVFTCGLRSNGSAWCWGGRENGRLGDGSSAGDIGTPVQVKNSANSGVWSDWIDIESSNEASCGLRSNGTVWCWGEGYDGQFGNGVMTTGSNVPVQVKDSAGTGTWSDWVKISKGYSHVCGIRSNGTAWCWGANYDGQIGNGVTSNSYSLPVQVQTNTGPGGWNDWFDIQAGVENTCGIRSGGSMWCWGTSVSAAINTSGGNVARPSLSHSDTSPTAFTDWSAVSVGYNYGCSVRTNGLLYCWGDDSTAGRLGTGPGDIDRLRPYSVP